jgi:hypothetical protein
MRKTGKVGKKVFLALVQYFPGTTVKNHEKPPSKYE